LIIETGKVKVTAAIKNMIIELWKTDCYFAGMTTVCRNCNKSFSGEYQYCPHCGQKAAHHRLNMHHISHDFIHAFTHADKGILFLLKHLVLKPGKISREYVDGTRKKYFNPFSFLVLMVGVAFFLILQFETFAINYRNLNPADKVMLHFSFKYFNVFIFLMYPVNTFLSWAGFRKYKINYAEYLVLWAYLSGQQMFYYCIVILIFILVPVSIQLLGVITGIIVAIWFIAGLVQFHKDKSFANIVRAFLVILISQIIFQGIFNLAFYLFKPGHYAT
jgi:hypothetical protein